MKVAILFLLAVVVAGCSERDDSDPKEGRSGLHIYKDALTGCEYLSPGVGMVPRMGTDGKQICRKGETK